MTVLRPAPVSSALFDWNGSAYIAEASAFGRGLIPFGRVYDDACDEGLTLVSQRTGREVVFVVTHTQVRDGDILWWDLAPVRPADRAMARMRVFND